MTTLFAINFSTRTLFRSLTRSRSFFLLVAAATLNLAVGVAVTSAQTAKKANPAGGDEVTALFHDYRGVQLGMSSDEVRKKLGDPKDKSEEQDFFVFNDNETAQIVYDKDHKVITISADYLTAGATVPTAKQVFGNEVEAKADGAVYKLLRFPKAGYWLSYNKTSGSSPLTTITLQKIP